MYIKKKDLLCSKMNWPRDYLSKWSKSDRERQIPYDITYTWDLRGWDGWMASPTQWTWVWTNSGRWWRTGKPAGAAAAAAKTLQSCPTLCDPIDGSPLGSPWHAAIHGIAKSQIWFSNWKTITTKSSSDELTYKTETDSQRQKTNLWLPKWGVKD